VYLYFVDNGNIRRTDPATGATTTVFGRVTQVVGAASLAHRGADGNLYATALNNAYDYGYYYEDCVVQLNPVTRASTDVWSNGGNGWASMGQITAMPRDLFPHRGRHCRALLLVDTHSLNPCLLLQSRRPERRLHRRGQLPLCVTDSGTAIRRYDARRGNDPRSGTPGRPGTRTAPTTRPGSPRPVLLSLTVREGSMSPTRTTTV